MKILGMLSVFVVLAGCSSGSYVCHCPADGCDTCSLGEANLTLPFDADVIVAVSADPPCTAMLQPFGAGISINRTGAQSCTIHVTLASGVTDDGQVTFQRVTGECGCYLSASVSWSTPP